MTFSYDPDLLKKVITSDESLVYGYEIETKAKLPRFVMVKGIKEKLQ